MLPFEYYWLFCLCWTLAGEELHGCAGRLPLAVKYTVAYTARYTWCCLGCGDVLCSFVFSFAVMNTALMLPRLGLFSSLTFSVSDE